MSTAGVVARVALSIQGSPSRDRDGLETVAGSDLRTSSVLRQSADATGAAGSRLGGGTATAAAVDAGHESGTDPSEAPDEREGSGSRDLPVSAATATDRSSERSVGGGHHVHADASVSCVSGAVMDWYSRRILSWRLSNTLDVSFCVAALNEALARHGCPTVFNTDQGSQFTSCAFLEVLRGHGIAISMDGKGCWRDNVMIERFWRSLKYECVHLHAFDDPREADARIAAWIEFYNLPTKASGTGESHPRRSLP